MSIHPLAGKKAPYESLINVPRLISAYYTYQPDVSNPAQRVAFGTSGHRGSSLQSQLQRGAYPGDQPGDLRVPALPRVTAARCTWGWIRMPCLSRRCTRAIEVFAANGVEIVIQQGLGYTPTPVISHAILTYNRGRTAGLADGVVITPSHNPPEDGGFKYNPPSAGPADTGTTKWIQERANADHCAMA